MTDVHILDSNEKLIEVKNIMVLTQNQYCIIRNPIDKKTGLPQYGKDEIRRGEAKFFLQPKEAIKDGVKNIIVVNEEEALLVRAKVPYFDKRTKQDYKSG